MSNLPKEILALHNSKFGRKSRFLKFPRLLPRFAPPSARPAHRLNFKTPPQAKLTGSTPGGAFAPANVKVPAAGGTSPCGVRVCWGLPKAQEDP